MQGSREARTISFIWNVIVRGVILFLFSICKFSSLRLIMIGLLCLLRHSLYLLTSYVYLQNINMFVVFIFFSIEIMILTSL